jgi:hypothetical protein
MEANMTEHKKIALFIDVDNCDLEFSNYDNIINQLEDKGDILYGKVYGIDSKKHREILADSEARGFDCALPIRVKKRGAKVLDNRILVDVVELVSQSPVFDAVAVVAAPADMVYLYRFLKSNDIEVFALNNFDDSNRQLTDIVLDLGKAEAAPKAKKPRPAPFKRLSSDRPVAEPKPRATDGKSTEELLREIATFQTAAKPAPKERERRSAEPSIVKETDELFKQIEEIRGEKPAKVEEAPAPRVDVAGGVDEDLVKKIEDLRSTRREDQDQADYYDTLLKLLQDNK